MQDEAFELGKQWAQFYEPDSPSRKLINNLMSTAYLVNVVHNNFKDSEALFRPFYEAGERYKAHKSSLINGVNGVH